MRKFDFVLKQKFNFLFFLKIHHIIYTIIKNNGEYAFRWIGFKNVIKTASKKIVKSIKFWLWESHSSARCYITDSR